MTIEQLLIQGGAFQVGDFTLANGRKSDVYVDCKRMMMDGKYGARLAKALGALVSRTFRPPHRLAGVAEGGIPLVASMMFGSAWKGGWVRKDAKRHGAGGQLAGCLERGDEVILLEDVVTTGGSTMYAAETLEQNGLSVRGIVAIVNRSGVDNPFDGLGVPFYALTTLEKLKAEAAK